MNFPSGSFGQLISRARTCMVVVAAGAMLAGCATLSPEQCRRADWRHIGFVDGSGGASAARINDHAKACAEVGIRPDPQAYLDGREQGMRRYCMPENGFDVGRRGAAHNAGDCPEPMKYAFLDQYQRGYQIHLIEEDLRHRRALVERNYQQARNNEHRIFAIRRELDKRDLPADRRTTLLNEYQLLLNQQNSLIRESRFLQHEADRIQLHLHMNLRDSGHWR